MDIPVGTRTAKRIAQGTAELQAARIEGIELETPSLVEPKCSEPTFDLVRRLAEDARSQHRTPYLLWLLPVAGTRRESQREHKNGRSKAQRISDK
jgi:hypothetical protein